MKTYTPGYFWTKVVALIISLLVCVIGFVDMWFSIRLILAGTKCEAEVIRVEKTKPGEQDVIYSTTESIAEDKDRRATFWHFVEYTGKDGSSVPAKLNIASQVKPVYSVGDRVTIVYDVTKPEIAVAMYDLRTWALGFFIFIVGFCFGITSLYLVIYARKPIPVPDDTPLTDPDIKVVPDKA